MKLTLQASKEQVIALLEDAYACRTNNLNRSTELAKTALELSRTLNDPAILAESLSKLGLFFMIQGEYEPALAMSAEAIKYYESLNDEKGIANARYNIAGVYYKTDNY